MIKIIRPLAFLIALLSIADVSSGDPLTDAKNVAGSLAGSASGSYGSQAGIERNISNPITSSNTLMTTLDKSKSFNAQLTCPSSSAFLSVFVQPASTGDLQTVIVSKDLDMDGKPDYSYQLPVRVSGVCANGFISCDAGTWNNCSYYQWVADSTGKIQAANAQITDLGGCYCINSSCGSNLVWNNLGIVLKDLGGSVAGTLQATNPQLSVSNVSTDGPTISYYGQHAGGCTSAGGGTGTSNPEQYYSNPYSIQGAAQNLAQTESSDPNSYYSELAAAQNLAAGNTQLQQCSISTVLQCANSSPGYTDNINDGCQSLEANANCRLRDETVDGVQTWLNFTSTGLTPLTPACDSVTVQQIAPCSGFNASINWNGGHYIQFVGSGSKILMQFIADTCWCVVATEVINLPAGVTASGSSGWVDAYTDGRCGTTKIVGNGNTLSFSSGGTITLSGTTISGTAYYDSCSSCSNWNIYGAGDELILTDSCGHYMFNISSNCPLGSQYACIPRAQSTVLSGASVSGTNFTCPIDTSNGGDPICYTPPTTDKVCPDFLEKDRTYYCSNNAPFDFSAAQKRLGNVVSTTADNKTSMYYQDLTQNSSGNWTPTNVNSGLPSRDTYGDCELACKTEKANTNTQAAISGNASQFQSNNTQSMSFYYRTCVNGSCPAGPGETIVEDCQCINDFGEAAGLMQTLRAAGGDLICSDGVSTPLQ